MLKPAQVLKWIVPFVVSGGLLAHQLSTIDMGGVLGHVRGPVLLIFVPTLVLYGAISLWLEAASLVRALRTAHHGLRLWTIARIKAASYLLYIVHYTLGAGALTLLLRRRAGVGLGDAGGAVILVMLFDTAILLTLSAVSATFQSPDAAVVRASAVAVVGIGLLGGFTLLRMPRSLGPLDRFRSLPVLRAARSSSMHTLAGLGVLRTLFVGSFIAVGWSALVAFGIRPPLADTVLNIVLVVIVSMLPIAVAGLGTSQAAFVALFNSWADEGTLLACSLTLSAGLIVLRAGIGFLFSPEYVREALEAARHGPESA